MKDWKERVERWERPKIQLYRRQDCGAEAALAVAEVSKVP